MVNLGMGYSETWKILEEMIADFRKRGRVVPVKIMDDLKSARTMSRILKADESYEGAIQKIEEYLRSVESYLVSEGEEHFGVTYANEWLKRLDDASRKTSKKEEEQTRFIPGLPREKQWIRVEPSAELAIDRLKTLADDSSVSYRTCTDGSILIYGKKEHIIDFVKKMATKHGLKAEK
jgi:hypothetical protein